MFAEIGTVSAIFQTFATSFQTSDVFRQGFRNERFRHVQQFLTVKKCWLRPSLCANENLAIQILGSPPFVQFERIACIEMHDTLKQMGLSFPDDSGKDSEKSHGSILHTEIIASCTRATEGFLHRSDGRTIPYSELHKGEDLFLVAQGGEGTYLELNQNALWKRCPEGSYPRALCP